MNNGKNKAAKFDDFDRLIRESKTNGVDIAAFALVWMF